MITFFLKKFKDSSIFIRSPENEYSKTDFIIEKKADLKSKV